MKYILFFIFTTLVITSCGLTNGDIEDKYWWFDEIRHPTPKVKLRHKIDHIVFAESQYYTLVKDTIYRDDAYPKPYALIISRQKKPSWAIEIVLFDTGDTIRYIAK